MLKGLIEVPLGRLRTPRWTAYMIRAPGHHLGVCISRARDACVWRTHVSRQMHASEFLLRPVVVLAVEFLRDNELFKCLSYDWGITGVVHVLRNLNMCWVQFVICLNRTESTLD